MQKIKVVVGLIEHNGRVFIAQRSYGDLKGKWEFPGGKVEKGETEKKALAREILEELHISVRCGSLVCTHTFDYPDCRVELKLYRCSYLSGEVSLTDHSSCVFVDKSLLLSYDLTPTDIPLARYVVGI